MLGVVGGHVIGLLVPRSWTEAVGIDDHLYHYAAVIGGLVAGIMALVGMSILVYRRRTVGPVFSATTPMDKVMYAFLGAAIVLGMWNTIAGSIFSLGGEYNYREGVSVWYRSFLAFQPDADLMAEAPVSSGARSRGLRSLRAVAVHPPRARVLRAGRLPHPPLCRLPLARRPPTGQCRSRRGWDRVG